MYSNEKKKIHIGMDMELYEKASKLAKKENRSFANFVVHCIMVYCESNKTDTQSDFR